MKKRLIAILCVIMMAFSFILSSCSAKDIVKLVNSGEMLGPIIGGGSSFHPGIIGKDSDIHRGPDI